MNNQYTTNPLTLPDDLPRPVDDGGAHHLKGMRLPSQPLQSTTGEQIDVSKLPGRVVLYAYPMTGVPDVELPEGWNDIPGARGCTPQALAFQSQEAAIAALGAKVFGLSTQTPEYQRELADRLALTFPILSDDDFKLTEALRLPTMQVENMRLLKRLTLIVNEGEIEHLFYPVFPPNQAAADVIAWLHKNPPPNASQPGEGVTIYTSVQCNFCKAAKALLTAKGVPFEEIDVDADSKALNSMLARSGGQRTVPQIFIGKTHVGGADELQAMERSGHLAALLAPEVRA